MKEVLLTVKPQRWFLLPEIEATKTIFEDSIKKLTTTIPKFSAVGASRRYEEVYNHIEYLILTPDTKTLFSRLKNLLNSPKLTDNKIEATIGPLDIPITIYITNDPNEFGTKQFILTGPEEFLEKLPISSIPPLPTEEKVFKFLNLEYIPPELRDWDMAIELAKEGKLPNLPTLQDINGAFHFHTTWSDGMLELDKLAFTASKYGLNWIGISDHSKSANYAGGLEDERLINQVNTIKDLNKTLRNIYLLAGNEVDILDDGSLDYSDDILTQLDFVIASIHQGLKDPREKITNRLIAALNNPRTSMIGHPTGRLLLQRSSSDIDFPKFLDAIRQSGKIIEVNGQPDRLDLPYHYLRELFHNDNYVSINPDMHKPICINNIYFGLIIARKGGIDKSKLLNIISDVSEVKRILKEV